MKKLILLLIFTALLNQLSGQTFQFNGLQHWFYQQPILLDNGKWDAIYDSDGRSSLSGTININEKDKTFCITESSGQSLKGRINEMEHNIQTNDIDFGQVTKTIYKGISTESSNLIKLVFMQTRNAGIVIRLYFQRIINTGIVIQGKEVKFDDWECYHDQDLFLNISIVK